MDSAQGITVNGADGAALMSLQDGTIYGADTSVIGSYQENPANGRMTFFDNAHQELFSAAADGTYYDGNGATIGKMTNNGAVTSFVDMDGNITFQQNLDGAPIIGKDGIEGYTHKA